MSPVLYEWWPEVSPVDQNCSDQLFCVHVKTQSRGEDPESGAVSRGFGHSGCVLKPLELAT